MKTRNDCREWRELLGRLRARAPGGRRAGRAGGAPRGLRPSAATSSPRWRRSRGCSPSPTRRGSSRRRSRRRSWGGGSRRRSRASASGRSSAGGGASSAASPSAGRRRPRRRRCCSSSSSAATAARTPSQQVEVRRASRRASASTRRWSPMPTAPRSTCTCTGCRSGTLCRVWLRGPHGASLSRPAPSATAGATTPTRCSARRSTSRGRGRSCVDTGKRTFVAPVESTGRDVQRSEQGGSDVKQDHLRARAARRAGAGDRRLRRRRQQPAAAPTAARRRRAAERSELEWPLRQRRRRRAPRAPKAATASSRAAKVGDLGTVLVDSEGLTLYDFHKDKGGELVLLRRLRRRLAPAPDRRRTAGRRRRPGEPCSARPSARTAPSRSPTPAGPLYTYVGDKSPGEANGNDFSPVRRRVVRPAAERRRARGLSRQRSDELATVPWSSPLEPTKEPRNAERGRDSVPRFLSGAMSRQRNRGTEESRRTAAVADLATAQGGVVSLDQLGDRGYPRSGRRGACPGEGPCTASTAASTRSAIARCLGTTHPAGGAAGLWRWRGDLPWDRGGVPWALGRGCRG